jgi:hypothetical protein
MLTFKPGVQVVYFDERIALVLRETALWSVAQAIPVHVTSIDDPAPGRVPNTFHGKSLAVDVNLVDTVDPRRAALADWLVMRLPAGFDVILEGDHIHVEADPKRALLHLAGG